MGISGKSENASEEILREPCSEGVKERWKGCELYLTHDQKSHRPRQPQGMAWCPRAAAEYV